GLFDMPAFIKSTKDNKKLYGKTAFCLKIYLKLMDVGYDHITIKLRLYNIKYSRDYFFFLKARLRKFKGLHA
ncbi:hypothetical protein, partial [Bacillus cereus group sp. BfR-BA-01356]|uniref:hypothetical protein n=1 Tax=Bacillus cereus group sp. BfR-BA-01356 TaxID=2920319 RepID=UPI001F560707